MDNLSHSLTGLAVGELIDRTLAPEADPRLASIRRRMLLVTTFLAANLPDLDLVLTRTLPAPLGYLLHHRGHTHTILFALVQALALAGLVWLLWPAARRLLGASRDARRGLCAAVLAGLATHLLLDYLNSYGLHPFYPVDMRWLYGDMIFIVEPVFWFALGVPLIAMIGTRWLKALLLATLPMFLAWALSKHYLHWSSAAALSALAGALFMLQHRAGARSRRGVAAGVALALLFIAVQGWSSNYGKDMVADHLQRLDRSSRLLDVALTPFPANPACWSFASVELAGEHYRLRRGMLSLAPGLLPQSSCPAGLNMVLTSSTPALGLAWEASTPLDRLRARARDCHFAAWLRFARLPHVQEKVAIDARFSNRGGNFTTFEFARFAGLPCSDGVPGWTMPRQDLLGGHHNLSTPE